MHRAALTAALVCSACTPAMHRAYRATLVGASVATTACSVNATRVGLRDLPAAEETNWIVGTHPSTPALVGVGAANVALVSGVAFMPDLIRRVTGRPVEDRDQFGQYMLDALTTAFAVVDLGMAYNDSTLTSRACGL